MHGKGSILEKFFRYADGRAIKEDDYAYLIDSSYSARGDNIDSYIGTSPDENIFQRKYSLSNNGQVLRIHNVGMTRKFISFIKYDWILAQKYFGNTVIHLETTVLTLKHDH